MDYRVRMFLCALRVSGCVCVFLLNYWSAGGNKPQIFEDVIGGVYIATDPPCLTYIYNALPVRVCAAGRR